MGIVVYHNARCGKSRECLAHLDDLKVKYEVREYLKDPLSEEELTDLIDQLGIKPKDLVRTTEALYKEKYAKRKIYGKEWIRIMAKNPVLIQRPIVVNHGKAIIARPADAPDELLK